MYQIIQFSKARNNLTHYINEVEKGCEFIIVRFGSPVATLAPYRGNEDALRLASIIAQEMGQEVNPKLRA